MRIIRFEAENVKRLRAVEITPKGDVVRITGKNRQGKTSVLDAIWWALEGARNVQRSPIRDGTDSAEITLDLGDYIVTRTLKRAKTASGGKAEQTFTTEITVKSADGRKLKSPQAILDGLIDSLSFDPLAFTRMKPKDQLTAMRRFVSGFDFDAFEDDQQRDFDARTDINRDIRREKMAADQIKVPEGAPEKLVDLAPLLRDIEDAATFNAELEAGGPEAELKRRIWGASQAIQHEERGAESIRERISGLRAALAREEASLAAVVEGVARRRAEQDAWRAESAALPPRPAPRDVEALRNAVEDANALNEGVELRRAKKRHTDKVEELEKTVEEIEARMKKREEERREIIAAAQLPVTGLGFASDHVTLNGQPFEQASDAEQLRAALEIAMANNPKLRVLRVRDASLMDDEAMEVLATFAAEKDFQVWTEEVRNDMDIGVVMQDGMVAAIDGEKVN